MGDLDRQPQARLAVTQRLLAIPLQGDVGQDGRALVPASLVDIDTKAFPGQGKPGIEAGLAAMARNLSVNRKIVDVGCARVTENLRQ